MKQAFAIFITIFTLAGCSDKHPANKTLLAAEQIADEQPASAMDMIFHGKDTLLHNEADSALYNLLYVETLQNSNVHLYDSAMMDFCERFYTREKDKKRLARAKTHYGIMMMHHHQMVEAALKMKEAEELADEIGNATICYAIHNALGDLNRLANCRSLMVAYYQKTIEDARKIGNPDWTAETLNKLAMVYRVMGDNGNFRKYINECKPLLNHLQPAAKTNVLTSLGAVEFYSGNKQRAHKYLDSALRILPNEYATLLLGDLHKMEGDKEKAVDLWYEATNTFNTDILIPAYQRLIDHFNTTGNYRIAYDLSSRMNAVYHNLSNAEKTVEVAKIQADYDKRVERSTFHHRLIVFGSIIVMLITAIFVFFTYHRHKAHRYMDIIRELNAKFDNTQSHKKQMLMNAETVYHLHRKAASAKSATHEDWEDIMELMMQNSPNFFENLYQRGNLSDKERNICILIKLRFQPSEIASLTDSSPQNITNIRQRLLQRLFGKNGGAKDFDQMILDL